jgi:hypothetical protein
MHVLFYELTNAIIITLLEIRISKCIMKYYFNNNIQFVYIFESSDEIINQTRKYTSNISYSVMVLLRPVVRQPHAFVGIGIRFIMNGL